MIGSPEDFLVAGTNILAIQGLNVSDKNPTFLVSPELTGVTLEAWSPNGMYFTTPTPGASEPGRRGHPGPIIQNALHTPNIPLDTEDLLVTAQVLPTFHPISNVTMSYRVMFGSEVPVPMNDSGTDGDLAGRGRHLERAHSRQRQHHRADGALLHHRHRHPNQQLALAPLSPTPPTPPNTSAPSLSPATSPASCRCSTCSRPRVCWIPGRAPPRSARIQRSGGRVSAYFDGEFYDNIFMRLRGNTTAGYNKKSHRLQFNREHLFRHPGPGGRIRKTSFTADYPDPAYMRQGLSFWLCGEIGAPGPFYDPYRLQLNGAFYQLANHNDLHGEELLDRLGYDPDGALYNAAGMIVPSGASTGGFDKKTRTWEGNADYVALANAISESLSTCSAPSTCFDHFDLPQVISYLVAARFVHENDDVWANMSMYHDNDGDDLWRIIPFDMNLSWGAAYMDTRGPHGIQVDNDASRATPSMDLLHATGSRRQLEPAV